MGFFQDMNPPKGGAFAPSLPLSLTTSTLGFHQHLAKQQLATTRSTFRTPRRTGAQLPWRRAQPSLTVTQPPSVNDSEQNDMNTNSFAELPEVPTPPSHIKPHLPDIETYKQLYNKSITDPDGFWLPIIEQFHWESGVSGFEKPYIDSNFNPRSSKVYTNFLRGATTNVCYNAVDKWALSEDTKNNIAYYCEGNDRDSRSAYTYLEVYEKVCAFANVLRDQLGVKKGDVVIIYMPMIIELPVAMLACARIGAVHSVVFGGFSAESLAGRIKDSNAKVILTAHSVGRGAKTIPLKKISDDAIRILKQDGFTVDHQVVVDGEKHPSDFNAGIDKDWDVLTALEKGKESAVEWVESEHPLFILYTSGSTGKPKGVLHTTSGYMVYSATTFKYSFDFHREQGDIFFSTSDCGWITGHSYVTYGPMLNGASQVLYEGVPNYPDAGRLWEVCEQYGVTQLYTAPTVIRALKGSAPPSEGTSSSDWVTKYDLSKLRVLGTVGEPINPEAWEWYFNVVGGGGRATIVDTWWQTETGGHCIVSLPIPGMKLKPGSAMLPFFGIEPVLLDADGKTQEKEGFLCIKNAWPGTLRTVYGDHSRMEETYFNRFPGFYMTGDGAKIDDDGHWWLTGRVDDILNVSGHRIGTAEVESAIVLHESITEAAVVGIPHKIKGEALYAYVTPLPGTDLNEELKKSIKNVVRKEIGPFASPDTIHFAPALPKTRSGKIMRRILRKIAAGGKDTNTDDLGDTSTLTDPGVVHALLETYGC